MRAWSITPAKVLIRRINFVCRADYGRETRVLRLAKGHLISFHRCVGLLWNGESIDMRLLVAIMVVSAPFMSQASADQLLDELLACRHMPDSTIRLECFDRTSDAALTVRQPTDPPQPAKHPPIESGIVGISKPVTGRVSFTLENGQVWRQMDAESAKSANIGDRVEVSKTFLGAYWLKIEGGRKWRVTFVQSIMSKER